MIISLGSPVLQSILYPQSYSFETNVCSFLLWKQGPSRPSTHPVSVEHLLYIVRTAEGQTDAIADLRKLIEPPFLKFPCSVEQHLFSYMWKYRQGSLTISVGCRLLGSVPSSPFMTFFFFIHPSSFLVAEVYKRHESLLGVVSPAWAECGNDPFKPWPETCNHVPVPSVRAWTHSWASYHRRDRCLTSCGCGICIWMPHLQQVPVTK